MIIGIDGNEANVEKKVGVSEFAYELLVRFAEFRISNLEFRIYLKQTPNSDLPKESESWVYHIVKPSMLWTQIGLPLNLYISKPQPDVFFTPSHYAPRFSPIPTVVSVMDLSYIKYPEMFKKNDLYQLNNWTSYSVKNAAKIITISKSSKDDIIKMYGISEAKIEVVYPGVKFEILNPKSETNSKMENSKVLINKYNIDGEYILFVGTLQPRKNIVRLAEAFARLQSRESEVSSLTLVIVGKKGWLYEEILEAPKKFGIEDKVKFLDFVSNEDLPLLYKYAKCFILPSLYEGFGLPILEAMFYGCPVITSNVSSLPEAGGDAAVYIDPESVDDITKAIMKVLTDKKLRSSMIKKGYEQVKKFSWEKSAKQVLNILEEVGKK